MFSAVGYIIELKSGKPWEAFMQQRILDPLDMKSTVYTVADMLKKPDFGVGFTERRDSNEIYRIPYYEDIAGVAPVRSHHFKYREHVALADCPDECGQI